MERAANILHADLDAFYASVEQRDDPALRGRPVIVGGGVVLAASYEAKRRGVKTAMGGRQALALCPDAVCVAPRIKAYVEASKAVFAIFEETTPLVEGISIDEAFLDVGGLGRLVGSPSSIAERLRSRVLGEVGLPISVGVASTKFLAKVASAVCKPDGLLHVEAGAELAFLHPLGVQRLWGVGPVTTEKLAKKGITKVFEVAALDEATLCSIVGKGAGSHLHALAHNLDPRPIVTNRKQRSIGSQSAMGRGKKSQRELEVTLLGVVERVSRRMRKSETVGRTVTLRLRFGDYRKATRSHTLPEATASTDELWATVHHLLRRETETLAADGCTLVGMSVSKLSAARPCQLRFDFDPPRPKVEGTGRRDALDDTRDSIVEKFGNGALSAASQLGRRRLVSPHDLE